MTTVLIIPSRAEMGPMQSVAAAMPEATIIRFDSRGMSPAVAMSQALTYFTVAYRSAGATRVICLGDRYETLAAALAAMFLRIPVAHIHGGETTTGAFDDAMRHAMTHISDLHFVATGGSANRVAQLLGRGEGELFHEHYKDIHLVGAPGLDGITQSSAKRDRKRILVTFHPETRAPDYGVAACQDMLDALREMTDYEIVLTGVNNDPGCDDIIRLQRVFEASRDDVVWADGMSHDEYIAEMQHAALVIGNSSSGVIEAPWVGCPSVNIGRRQDGRPCAPSVFNWSPGDETPLSEVIVKACGFMGFSNPYYVGGAAPKIATILRAADKAPEATLG